MSARFLVPQAQYRWTLSLDQCPNTGVGVSDNNQHEHGAHRNNEDRYFNGMNHNVELCMVLDGHDGDKAADFARLHIPGKLLAEGIRGGPEEVIRRINSAFKETEMQFFMAMDDALTRKLSLQSEINSRARNSYEAQRMYPDQVAEIKRLENQIRGGATVVLSLVVNNNIYIANVGDSRAILCQNVHGKVTADQLSDDHNVYNPSEQERLARLGLDAQTLVHCGRLGPYQFTRSIGDHDIKGGYRDVEILSSAREEPGIADPFINGPWPITNLQNGFLLLMSDGLYEAYGTYIESGNPQEVHEGIAALVVEEMNQRGSVSDVAQATVNRVRALVRTCPGSPRLDDITLIIRNFNHKLHMAEQVDTPIVEHRHLPVRAHSQYNEDNGGGEFIPEGNLSPWEKEPAPSTEVELQEGMERMSISHGGPSKVDPVFPPEVELTEQQRQSGKFIQPYILFPLSFPYEKGLDEF